MGRRSYLDLDEINSEDELGSIASELKTCSFEGFRRTSNEIYFQKEVIGVSSGCWFKI